MHTPPLSPLLQLMHCDCDSDSRGPIPIGLPGPEQLHGLLQEVLCPDGPGDVQEHLNEQHAHPAAQTDHQLLHDMGYS